MVNRKGYIKTLEAVIGVIIIIIVSYTLISRQVSNEAEQPLNLYDSMGYINTKIELDENLREGIVDPAKGFGMGIDNLLEDIIEAAKPKNFDFTCMICSNTSINKCYSDNVPLEKDVYVNDLLIASAGVLQDPKIVRMWFWKKPTTDVLPFLNECQIV